MNGLSVTELCCLFCCPPCPGRIAAKLAFLPPEPTYSLVPGGAGTTASGTLRASTGTPRRWELHLMERSDFQYSQRELDTTEVFLTKSSRGNGVACTYVRCVPGARYTVLFSRGNAVDLGQMSSFCIGLGTRLNCNIFSSDYSGYGVSSGRPSEKNLYAEHRCYLAGLAYQERHPPREHRPVRSEHRHSAHRGPGLPLGVHRGGEHSPLTSGVRVAFPDTRKTYCFDAFPNMEKVSKIRSPVLIHGTEDEVIDFSHGLAPYERIPKAVEPLWVEGAGHNDIELYSQDLERLRRCFISQELPSQRA